METLKITYWRLTNLGGNRCLRYIGKFQVSPFGGERSMEETEVSSFRNPPLLTKMH